ncbi:16S rRNA (cytidine(1402)-2'-O)-methyltransferase [Pelagibacterales bacterium SAG-MED43]|nr:16S rRNA (cytidine(1402)-2'-O)-methyltransferase [Pelagibacterales bacterium SAG-MED43]
MMVNPKLHKSKLKKGLYLIPTPIGNLGDITLRAIELLENSDFILCEDTRVSKKLLDKFEIRTSLISNHKFNEIKNLTKIINILKDNKIVSIISDAGTPGISDPGAILINECLKQSIDVIPLPGPSAVTTAISVSGFKEKYIFYGFFPEKEKMIKEELEKLSSLNFCLVFFVSPKKINKIIPYLKSYFNDRKILICREISKYYEEYIRSDLEDLKLFKTEPKGELTIVLSEKQFNKNTSQILSESDKKNIKTMINKLSTKEITEIINQNRNVSKKKIYEYCLKLKNEK